MKKNLKVNLILVWSYQLILILKGLELFRYHEPLLHPNLNGIKSILMDLVTWSWVFRAIYTWTSWFHGSWCLFISYHHWYDGQHMMVSTSSMVVGVITAAIVALIFGLPTFV